MLGATLLLKKKKKKTNFKTLPQILGFKLKTKSMRTFK